MGNVQRAKELTGIILEKTKQLVLTGDAEKVEEEVAAYVNLIESREPLVQELSKLDFDEQTRSSHDFKIIKQAVADITEIDKRNLELVQEMHETIKDAIKLAKQGQRVSRGYQAMSSEIVSARFDIKQ